MLNEVLRIIERNEPISFFLGAGVSIGSSSGSCKGLGTGQDLADYLIAQFGLSLKTGTPLMTVCDECSFNNESRFREVLREYLNDASPQTTHSLLVDIISLMNEPNDFILTVNVDDLLEHEWREKKGKLLNVAKKSKEIYYGGQKTYLKVHGCVTDIENAIFTTKDYLNIDKDNLIYEKLRALFAERSIVFIGFSLQDIDILKMLYNVRPANGFLRPHFWVNPKGSNWSDSRARFYSGEFNIRHIEMNAETFLNEILKCLQKKKIVKP